MGNPPSIRRDFKRLRQRRFHGVDLLHRGRSQSDVARELGVARQTVARWAKLDRQRELNGTPPGRRPRLSNWDLNDLERLVDWGGKHLTCQRLAKLIERKFGVRYHPGHVRRVLKRAERQRLEHWESSAQDGYLQYLEWAHREGYPQYLEWVAQWGKPEYR